MVSGVTNRPVFIPKREASDNYDRVDQNWGGFLIYGDAVEYKPEVIKKTAQSIFNQLKKAFPVQLEGIGFVRFWQTDEDQLPRELKALKEFTQTGKLPKSFDGIAKEAGITEIKPRIPAFYNRESKPSLRDFAKRLAESDQSFPDFLDSNYKYRKSTTDQDLEDLLYTYGEYDHFYIHETKTGIAKVDLGQSASKSVNDFVFNALAYDLDENFTSLKDLQTDANRRDAAGEMIKLGLEISSRLDETDFIALRSYINQHINHEGFGSNDVETLRKFNQKQKSKVSRYRFDLNLFQRASIRTEYNPDFQEQVLKLLNHNAQFDDDVEYTDEFYGVIKALFDHSKLDGVLDKAMALGARVDEAFLELELVEVEKEVFPDVYNSFLSTKQKLKDLGVSSSHLMGFSFHDIVSQGVNLNTIYELEKAIDLGQIKDSEALKKFFQIKFESYFNLERALSIEDPSIKAQLLEDFKRKFGIPNILHLFDYDFSNKAINDYLRIYQRAVNTYRGFGAYTFAMKGGKDSQFNRFVQAVSSSSFPIHADDFNVYPAGGVSFTGLKSLDTVFDRDYSDPSNLYPVLAEYLNELNDMPDTRFDFLRSAIVITNEKDKFTLPGIDGKPVNYSYMVYNDHFRSDGTRAILVPSDLIQNIIDTNKGKNIPEDALRFESLKKDALKYNGHVLDICSISNLAGSMAYSYPVASKPYLNHIEVNIDRNNRTARNGPDINGHYGGIENNLVITPGLKKAHEKINNLVNSYQNLFFLLNISFSEWKKMHTVVNEDGEHFDELASLNEAMKWHQQGEQGITDPKKFPVLAVTSPTDQQTVPTDTPFVLDTYDMTLRFADGKSVPSFKQEVCGYLDLIKLFNNEEFGGMFMFTNQDLRLFSRDDLPNLAHLMS